MDRIVSTHNMKLLSSISDADQLQAKKCSCSAADKINCPLDNQCLTTELVYQADVSSSDGATKMYIGLTEPTFKQRLYNHQRLRKFLILRSGSEAGWEGKRGRRPVGK